MPGCTIHVLIINKYRRGGQFSLIYYLYIAVCYSTFEFLILVGVSVIISSIVNKFALTLNKSL